MNLTVYKAKLHTAGKTPEQILKGYTFGPKPSDDVVQTIIKGYESIDGLEVCVTNSLLDKESYVMVLWNKKDDGKFKEFIYCVEQDPFSGTYVDDRDQFDKDWDTEEYEPPGALSFDKEEVEIIEQINCQLKKRSERNA